MPKFKDRKRELKELERTLSKKGFAFEIIYGRRRVGKTELILNATKNKRRIYYLATEANNLNRFYNECVNFEPGVSKLKKDFEVLFEYLKDKTDVIIIDEFQNMIKEDSNFLSLLQAIIDTKLKDSNLKLFILGSSVSVITSKVLSYKSPVYGRKTGSLNLRPVSFFDLLEFFPNASLSELVEIYGFADGIPYYLVMIERKFWRWLKDELVREKGFLKDEIDFLMKFEFEDSGTYKLILEAIANGKTKIGEIKDYIGFQRTDITSYLRNLIEVGFIKREVPITENVKSRFGRYFLNDNFLRFWFRFIYPNLSSIEQRALNINNLKRDYVSYLGFIFEDICIQYLFNKKEDFTKIGRWWYQDKEIDIVALNESKKEILFGECKWKDNVNAQKVLRDLIEKTKHVQWNNETRKERFVVFAKSFKKKLSEFEGRKVECFALKDIGRVMRKNN